MAAKLRRVKRNRRHPHLSAERRFGPGSKAGITDWRKISWVANTLVFSRSGGRNDLDANRNGWWRRARCNSTPIRVTDLSEVRQHNGRGNIRHGEENAPHRPRCPPKRFWHRETPKSSRVTWDQVARPILKLYSRDLTRHGCSLLMVMGSSWRYAAS